MKNNKKSGFTLSEVMLALTLIGVVSALTITNLSYSMQSKARLSEFKAAYSKLETALKDMTNDSGAIYQCYTCMSAVAAKNSYGVKTCTTSVFNGCPLFKSALLKNLGVIRTCTGDTVEGGCLPKRGYPKTGINSCFNNDITEAYVLDNSMILFFDSNDRGLKKLDLGAKPGIWTPIGTYAQTAMFSKSLIADSGIDTPFRPELPSETPTQRELINLYSDFKFAIDVNGKKGPNKWGQDLFTFTVSANEVKKVGEKEFVTNVGIYPTDSCNPGETEDDAANSQGAPKSSAQLYKEMLNVR